MSIKENSNLREKTKVILRKFYIAMKKRKKNNFELSGKRPKVIPKVIPMSKIS